MTAEAPVEIRALAGDAEMRLFFNSHFAETLMMTESAQIAFATPQTAQAAEKDQSNLFPKIKKNIDFGK